MSRSSFVALGVAWAGRWGKLEDRVKVAISQHSFATSEPDALQKLSKDAKEGEEDDSSSPPIEEKRVKKPFEFRERIYYEPIELDYSEFEIVDEVQRLFKSYDPQCDPKTLEPMPREVAEVAFAMKKGLVDFTLEE